MKNSSKITVKKIATLMMSTSCVFIATQTHTVMGQTKEIKLAGDGSVYNTESTTGTAGTAGGNGQAAYVFTTNAGTTPSDNKVNVTHDITIIGGARQLERNDNSGGSGISGSDLTLTNSGTISGGAGSTRGFRGNGGSGIVGSNLIVMNSGTISGGDGNLGGFGGFGGIGGNGISGNNLTVTNEIGATIRGGSSGVAQDGGAGIFGDDLIITNRGIVSAGNGGIGGIGGIGISGNNLTVTNSGTISAGNGIFGGIGISGSNLSVKNSGTISSGNGGTAGNGGYGGTGVSGSDLTVTNSGTIIAGNGGVGDSAGYGISFVFGGYGGSGISGSNSTITNSGTIIAGNGGDALTAGNGGAGGAGVSGSDLTITNSGIIQGGAGGVGQNGGVNGVTGAAILIKGGSNSLTLETNSNIIGDIVLSPQTDATTNNTLSIASNATTTITGNLTAGAYTDVSLSGETITFTGDASFEDNTSLTFHNLVDGVALSANRLILSDTSIQFANNGSNISNWTQDDYKLVTTTNGVSGAYNSVIENNLLTDGAKDYAGLIITNGGLDLSYSLKWNDVSNAANDAYGTFDLRDEATLTLGVALADNVAVTASNENDWDGKSLTKAGLGTLILNAKNTYTGSTDITRGTLKTGVADAFANTSSVDVALDATLNLGGNSQTLGAGAALTNAGTVLINDWNAALLTSPVTITGNMINNGLVVINNCTTCAGQTLAVTGDWTGNGGTVSFGTVLGDDSSLTDKLTISGAATGTTYVIVANESGTGAQTLEGIELITTGNSTADAFVMNGRVVSGSYDYGLQQGTESGTNLNNWYLTSKLTDNGGDTYRPELGSYASNLAAVATMFNLRLNDRQGEGYYVDPVTGERNGTNLWLRYEGTHSKNQMIGGQLDNKGNRTVFQIGGDVLGGSFNDNDLWRLGVMGGYGHQNTATRNHLTGYRSDAEVSGYSVGLYGTWYQNGKDHSGFYVDSWLQYNWFNNTVDGYQLQGEKYKSKGFSASIEGGYNFLAGTVNGLGGVANNMFIRPQGQVVWSGVKADGHTEANGTQIYGLGHNNIQTRLGLRISLSSVDRQASYNLMPFIEANWINNSKKYGVEMNGVSNFIDGSRNLGEVKVGLEGNFNDNLSAWGTIGHQMGSNSYRETKGVIGLKYRF